MMQYQSSAPEAPLLPIPPSVLRLFKTNKEIKRFIEDYEKFRISYEFIKGYLRGLNDAAQPKPEYPSEDWKYKWNPVPNNWEEYDQCKLTAEEKKLLNKLPKDNEGFKDHGDFIL